MKRLVQLTTPLLVLTVITQFAILYLDWHRSRRTSGATSRPPAIQDAPPNTVADFTGLPSLGNQKAKVYVIEFADFECPFCKSHATGTFEELKQKFVDSGMVRYIFVNHPLAMHAHARMLATAGICADQQQRFWDLHHLLFERAPRSRYDLLSLVRETELDARGFMKCFDDEDGKIENLIDSQSKQAENLGLQGTPSFAVGRVTDEQHTGRVSIRKVIRGAQPLETFSQIFDEVARGL